MSPLQAYHDASEPGTGDSQADDWCRHTRSPVTTPHTPQED